MSPSARRALLLGGMAVSLPAALVAWHYLDQGPETAWFYEMRAFPGSELLGLPAGLAFGALAASLPRPLLLGPLLACVLVTFGPFLKPLVGPLPVEQLRARWARQVCLQSTLATCGPASAATVLRAHGLASDEATIARAAHTYIGGTEAWYLMRQLRARGLQVRCVWRETGALPLAAELPAIIGVKTEAGGGHFIAVLTRNGDRFALGDPMVGPEDLDSADLRRRYQPTGFALIVRR